MRRPAWVVMTYVVLLLLAVATALPNFLPMSVRSTIPDWATSQTVSLGLDLQGNAHLLLAVDLDDLAESRLQELRETLAVEMRARNLDPGAIHTEELTLSAPSDDALLAAMPDAAAATAEPGSPSDFSVDLSDGILQLALAVPSITTQRSARWWWYCRDNCPRGFTRMRLTWCAAPRSRLQNAPHGRS